MFAKEVHSLKAISELESEFPYAGTLLIYVVLERCLKLHLLENRKTLTDADVNLEYKVRGKRKLSKFRDLDDNAFIREFLVHCTLGNLEGIYKIQDKRYSASRNKVFHSDLFLRAQREHDFKSRDEENRKYLKTAKDHLIEASERYFRQKITESNGLLEFES
jgi:hypothetical protein